MDWLQKFYNDWNRENYPHEPLPKPDKRFTYRAVSLEDQIKFCLTRTTFGRFKDACEILLNRAELAVVFARGFKTFNQTGEVIEEVRATWDWRSQEDGEKEKPPIEKQFGRAMQYVSDVYCNMNVKVPAFALVCDSSGSKDSEIKLYLNKWKDSILTLSWRMYVYLHNAGRWLEDGEPPKPLAEYLAANPDVKIQSPRDFEQMLISDSFLLSQQLKAYVNEGVKFVEKKGTRF